MMLVPRLLFATAASALGLGAHIGYSDYVTNADKAGAAGGYSVAPGRIFSAETNSETIKEWGWDVNGGIAFSGTLRPSITARYNKIKEYKAGGIAVGLRFGR